MILKSAALNLTRAWTYLGKTPDLKVDVVKGAAPKVQYLNFVTKHKDYKKAQRTKKQYHNPCSDFVILSICGK
jgi:hypothetical protein